jgi:antitoxin component YwqK of YwqJK toxin-antitoxin module
MGRMTILRLAILPLVAALGAGCVQPLRAAVPDSPPGTRAVVEEHWPNGQLRLRKQVLRLEDGSTVDDGTFERWYSDGGKEYEAVFVNGKKEGTTVRYHRNGRIASREEYEDGQRNGASVSWDDAGSKVKEENWADGRPHGTWTIWQDGKVEWTHTYVHGDPTP